MTPGCGAIRIADPYPGMASRAGLGRKKNVVAKSRAASNSGAGDDCRTLPDLHVVPDLYQIINHAPGARDGSEPKEAAVSVPLPRSFTPARRSRWSKGAGSIAQGLHR